MAITHRNPSTGHTRTINHGDTVTSFRGVEYIFIKVTRLPEEGRSGKILVEDPKNPGEIFEFYDMVFPGLKMEA